MLQKLDDEMLNDIRGGSGSNMMVGQGSTCGINNFNNLQ